MKHHLSESLARISSLQIELEEVIGMNKKHENTILEQFQKIELLIKNDGRNEAEMASIRDRFS